MLAPFERRVGQTGIPESSSSSRERIRRTARSITAARNPRRRAWSTAPAADLEMDILCSGREMETKLHVLY